MPITFGILGPNGSQSTNALAERFGFTRYLLRRRDNGGVDVLINYGLRGQRYNEFLANNRWVNNIPIINGADVPNKFRTITRAKNLGIPVPESIAVFRNIRNPNDFIFKPYYSQRGRGIMPAGEAFNNPDVNTHAGYYQQRINNRIYEVRVSGATWYNEPWAVWKKIPGEGVDNNQIAWNHDQGGIFERVQNIGLRVFRECIQYTRILLNDLRLQFGAADFIVDADRNIYFIEINTRPGFSPEYGAEYYYDMFQKLTEMSYEAIQALVKEPVAAPENPLPVVDRPVLQQRGDFQALRRQLRETVYRWARENNALLNAVNTDQAIENLINTGVVLNNE